MEADPDLFVKFDEQGFHLKSIDLFVKFILQWRGRSHLQSLTSGGTRRVHVSQSFHIGTDAPHSGKSKLLPVPEVVKLVSQWANKGNKATKNQKMDEMLHAAVALVFTCSNSQLIESLLTKRASFDKEDLVNVLIQVSVSDNESRERERKRTGQ